LKSKILSSKARWCQNGIIFTYDHLKIGSKYQHETCSFHSEDMTCNCQGSS